MRVEISKQRSALVSTGRSGHTNGPQLAVAEAHSTTSFLSLAQESLGRIVQGNCQPGPTSIREKSSIVLGSDLNYQGPVLHLRDTLILVRTINPRPPRATDQEGRPPNRVRTAQTVVSPWVV